MMRLRSRLAIYCAGIVYKAVTRLGRGSGSSLPGRIARWIDPEILSVLSGMVRKQVIAVTGTNGKTTTNGILTHVLETQGQKVLSNRLGANLPDGVISAFVLAAVETVVAGGIGAEIIPLAAGERIDFGGLDLICWGGCSDREQELAAGCLREIRQDFRAFADIHTKWEPERLVGNVVLKSSLFSMPVVGFENHAGCTCIGNYVSLGRVVCGQGNNGKDGFEGLVWKNVLATYLHGPLLPKDPQVCDYLLECALRRKYGEGIVLEELPDEAELGANRHVADGCRL